MAERHAVHLVPVGPDQLAFGPEDLQPAAPDERKPPKRRYDSAGRQAAAAQRRLAVIVAALSTFEERGWAGARLQDVSAAAAAETSEAAEPAPGVGVARAR